MAEQNQATVAEDARPEIPAEPAKTSDTGAEKQPQADQTSEPQSATDQPKRMAWWQHRINDLTREKYEAIRRANAAEEALRVPQSVPNDALSKAVQPPQEIERRALQLAQKMEDEREFNRAADAIYEKGKAEYADEFDHSLQSLGQLREAAEKILKASVDVPDAHRVLQALGANLDEAMRIAGLPERKMVAEMTKLALSPKAPKAVSKVPSPVSPVDGRGQVTKDPDKMDKYEWQAWRREQLRNRH